MALRDIRCGSWTKFPFIYRDGYVEQIRLRECKLGHGWTLNATVHDYGPEIWWEVARNPLRGSTVESHTGTARTSEQAIASADRKLRGLLRKYRGTTDSRTVSR